MFARHFWDDATGRVVDEWDRAWTAPAPYRGLNATMHSVEAMLAVGDVTGEPVWHERAAAHRGLRRRARRGPRRPAPRALRTRLVGRPRPQPRPARRPVQAVRRDARPRPRVVAPAAPRRGHAGRRAPAGLLPTSRALFDRAVADGWHADGAPGFVYTTDWAGTPVVRDRLHWVVAEGIAAAAALHRRTGEDVLRRPLRRSGGPTSTRTSATVERGSWHHELDPTNRPQASVWPGKPDLYHAVQATLLPRLPLARVSRGAGPVGARRGHRHDGRHDGAHPAGPRRRRGARRRRARRRTGGRATSPAGSPANVAITLGRLGRDVRLVTLLGDDHRGARWSGSGSRPATSASSPSPPAAGGPPAPSVTLDESRCRELRLRPRLGPRTRCRTRSATCCTWAPSRRCSRPAPTPSSTRSAPTAARALVSLDPNARPAITPDRTEPVARVEELVALSHVVKVSDEDLHWLHPDARPGRRPPPAGRRSDPGWSSSRAAATARSPYAPTAPCSRCRASR